MNKFEKKMKKEKRRKEEEKKLRCQTILDYVKDKKGAMGLRPFIINLALVTVFALCIISFVLYYLGTNAPDNELITNPEYGLQNATLKLNQSLLTFKEKANNVSSGLGSATPAPVSFVFLIFEQAFYIPQTMFAIMTTVPNLLLTILFPSLSATGMGTMISILLSLIGGIIIITLVFLTVKTIRSGESER